MRDVICRVIVFVLEADCGSSAKEQIAATDEKFTCFYSYLYRVAQIYHFVCRG